MTLHMFMILSEEEESVTMAHAPVVLDIVKSFVLIVSNSYVQNIHVPCGVCIAEREPSSNCTYQQS